MSKEGISINELAEKVREAIEPIAGRAVDIAPWRIRVDGEKWWLDPRPPAEWAEAIEALREQYFVLPPG